MGFGDDTSRWFLAQMKPNAARIAETNLSRQGFRTFLPREEQVRRQRNRFSTVQRPLFPGYLFVALDLDAGSWRAVASTSGVTRIVSFGDRPAPVPGAIVAALMARCDARGLLKPPSEFRAGDRVRLTTGPLADFVATVEEVDPDRRVWLLMDLMGGPTRVRAEAVQLCLA